MPDSALDAAISQLSQVVRNWDLVAQPIQLSTKTRGLNHAASHHIAWLVRSLAIDLFNEHGKLNFSQRLTKMLNEVFAEVAEVAERTTEDANALDAIASASHDEEGYDNDEYEDQEDAEEDDELPDQEEGAADPQMREAV